jgi:hypothetical protein
MNKDMYSVNEKAKIIAKIVSSSNKEKNIFVDYFIKKDNREIKTLSFPHSIKEFGEFNDEFNIDNKFVAGNYTIKAKINYKGLKVEDQTTFNVIKRGTCNDGIKNQNEEGIDCGGPCKSCKKDNLEKKQPLIKITNGNKECKCNDNKICTKDICIGGECIYKTITPCCGNYKCENGENFKNCPSDCEIVIITSSDIEANLQDLKSQGNDALGKYCLKIDDEYKDLCFLKASQITSNKKFCEHIKNKENIDNCYIYFLNKEDYSVCEYFNNPNLKKSCIMLRENKV